MKKEQLQLVTCKQAKKLKEAGFNWPVYHFYNSDDTLSCSVDAHERNAGGYSIAAPFLALALEWIRMRGIHCGITVGTGAKYFASYYYCGVLVKIINKGSVRELESALLDTVLEIILNKKDN